MFRGQYVTIDRHSPPLVSPDLDITVHAIDKRCKLRTEQEDVDAAKGRYAVESLGHGLLEGTGTEVGDHVPVNIHRGAALGASQSTQSVGLDL